MSDTGFVAQALATARNESGFPIARAMFLYVVVLPRGTAWICYQTLHWNDVA